MSTLSTNGLVPNVFTLTLIAQYGRQSWYLILLSVVTFALSTASLIGATQVWTENDTQIDFGNLPSCREINLKSLSNLLCGSDDELSPLDFTLRPTATIKWIWLLWASCLLWLLYCVLKQLLLIKFLRSKAGWLKNNRKSLEDSWIRKCVNIRTQNRLWKALYSLSFGYQFYLYSTFFRTSFVDKSWGFGQIVAITVWAPCFAEYLNLEVSK